MALHRGWLCAAAAARSLQMKPDYGRWRKKWLLYIVLELPGVSIWAPRIGVPTTAYARLLCRDLGPLGEGVFLS